MINIIDIELELEIRNIFWLNYNFDKAIAKQYIIEFVLLIELNNVNNIAFGFSFRKDKVNKYFVISFSFSIK